MRTQTHIEQIEWEVEECTVTIKKEKTSEMNEIAQVKVMFEMNLKCFLSVCAWLYGLCHAATSSRHLIVIHLISIYFITYNSIPMKPAGWLLFGKNARFKRIFEKKGIKPYLNIIFRPSIKSIEITIFDESAFLKIRERKVMPMHIARVYICDGFELKHIALMLWESRSSISFKLSFFVELVDGVVVVVVVNTIILLVNFFWYALLSKVPNENAELADMHIQTHVRMRVYLCAIPRKNWNTVYIWIFRLINFDTTHLNQDR